MNDVIMNNMLRANSIINNPLYKTILCSVSGGADSDVMVDICHRLDKDNKIVYVWFDTGLEYEATKRHLSYLENRYHINIVREKAIKSIPYTCYHIGQPFISKRVSDMIERLQSHDFKWEDKPFEELYREYPKCRAALRWWCNAWDNPGSKFGIRENKLLKEFMVSNPPTFRISLKCCKYAKKDVAKAAIKKYKADLNIFGVRKSEGGARQEAYKSCYITNKDTHIYLPIYWYTNEVKELYNKSFNIINSDCYNEYGLKRTGCCGCPYNRNFDEELLILAHYEPKLYTAVNHVFAESYDYTRKYRDFIQKSKKEL